MFALVGDDSREVLGEAARDDGAEAKGPVLTLLGICGFGGDGDLWACGSEDEPRASLPFFCSLGLSTVAASSA